MTDDRFDGLREFYARLDVNLQPRQAAALRPPDRQSALGSGAEIEATAEGNACGTCSECCRYYFYLSRHEFEYLAAALRDVPDAPSLRWVTCSSAIQDARRTYAAPDYRCPVYREGQGCMAYHARPLACRTLGPMRPYHARLPEACIYVAPEEYSSTEAIPGWREYLGILQAHGEATRGYFEVTPPGAGAQPT